MYGIEDVVIRTYIRNRCPFEGYPATRNHVPSGWGVANFALSATSREFISSTMYIAPVRYRRASRGTTEVLMVVLKAAWGGYDQSQTTVSDGGSKLTRDDLEAMRKEFGGSWSYYGKSQSLEDDLRQLRRVERLGMSLRGWSQARGVPLAYARALQRYLHQE
jgi:hypothetical protein